MIRVTVELLPGGSELHRKHLGTAEIENDTTGDVLFGNYKVRLSKWGKPTHTWKRGKVNGFPRKKLGPWDLLFRALLVTVGDRK